MSTPFYSLEDQRISPFMKTVNLAVDAPAARTAIGAGTPVDYGDFSIAFETLGSIQGGQSQKFLTIKDSVRGGFLYVGEYGESFFGGTQSFLGFQDRATGWDNIWGFYCANGDFKILSTVGGPVNRLGMFSNGNILAGATSEFPEGPNLKLEVRDASLGVATMVSGTGSFTPFDDGLGDPSTQMIGDGSCLFLTECYVGQMIYLDDGSGTKLNVIVASITDNNTMDLTAALAVGTTYTFTYSNPLFKVDSVGRVTRHANQTLVSQGVPASLAKVDLTAQGAAITATTLYAVLVDGYYRVSWVATVTRAATTSCVLGGATGFQIKYTDADDSVVKTSNPTTVTSSAVNATGTSISGVCIAYAKAGTNLQYLMGYTSVGVTTMQFNLHAICERL